MKKFLTSKFSKKKTKSTESTKITNETVAEHREQVLAGGRKFKYPVQYGKHKLVINASIIAVSFALLLAVLFWWQLYIVQNSSDFMYRLTKVVPVSVASVDGEPVPFDDYLARYRFNEFWLEKYGDIKSDSNDGRNQLKYVKQKVMGTAIENAYAKKIAPEYDIKVTDEDVENLIALNRKAVNGTLSEETFYSAQLMTNGWTKDDIKSSYRRDILRNKVSFAYDTQARKQVEDIAQFLKAGQTDFAKIVDEMADSKGGKVTYGQTGMIGIATTFSGFNLAEIGTLKVGEFTGPKKSLVDNSYFFIKVINKTEDAVSLSYIKVPLIMFSDKVKELEKSGLVKEYIDID